MRILLAEYLAQDFAETPVAEPEILLRDDPDDDEEDEEDEDEDEDEDDNEDEDEDEGYSE